MTAWRYGDLAIHQNLRDKSKWTMTHLPTGMAFSSLGVFDAPGVAAEAMLEVHTLRNCWDTLDEADCLALAAKAQPIFEKYQAIEKPGARWLKPLEQLPHLNGFIGTLQ